MTDFPLRSGAFPGGLRRMHPVRRVAAAASSVRRRAEQRLPDVRHGFMLARRLAPVAITLLLAEGFFLAGFFTEPLLSLPLGVLTIATLAVFTTVDYRADVREQELVDGIRRQQRQTAQDARRREARLLDDMGRLAAGTVEAAVPPALLSARLGLMAPILVDLLATPSAARRERLLGHLERSAVATCAELVGHAVGGGRAVLYRRVGGRFEPSWPEGAWPGPPPAAARTSDRAMYLRLLLRRRQVVQAPVAAEDGRARLGVYVPLHAGRRGVGVLYAERPGSGPLAAGELEAIVVVCGVLAAGSAGAHRPGGGLGTTVSDRSRARWARLDSGPRSPLGSARLTRASIVTRLESILETAESRRAVGATRVGAPPSPSIPSPRPARNRRPPLVR